MAIPKILHYCFGMSPDFGGKPWSLVHYVCLRSAIQQIKPDAVHFYYEYEPDSVWWEITKPLVSAIKIEAPRRICGRPLLSPAHRADIVRLMALVNHGGIYLDADVLVHRSFDDLLDHSVVLGQEGVDAEYGLCNAVILSHANSLFITRWIDQYSWFRGTTIGNPFWGEHSVQLPHFMARLFPNEVTMLDHKAFFWPTWTANGVYQIFEAEGRIDTSESYATHLWESQAWPLIQDMTPGEVRSLGTNFARWAKPYLTELPDDFGKTEEVTIPDERQVRRSAFQRTYAHHLWGDDGQSKFFSGVGSRGPAAQAYVDAISAEIRKVRDTLKRPVSIADLGCGDFVVGSAIIAESDNLYLGCDIVPELIDYNRTLYEGGNVSFRIVDVVVDALPEADIYLVRQVLQHLSNRDIQEVLSKLCAKANVYITEAHPIIEVGPINPDKPSNEEVRFDWRVGQGRGVDLNQPPFSLKVTPICEAVNGKEVIRTYRLLP